MCRFLIGAVCLFAAPSLCLAQHQHIYGSAAAFGPYAGGFRPLLYSAPILPTAIMPPMIIPQRVPYYSMFPFTSPFYYGGFGYGYGYGNYGYGGLGGGYLTSRYSYLSPYNYGNQTTAGFSSPSYYYPQHIVSLSGEFPATLVLEFPAPARVWLNDKEVPGEQSTTRTLASPVLRPGQQYTFHVRARWKLNGKSYEYTRDAAVGTGDRSKLLVVSGTALTEK
jgi:uncharacterized protein (TIGR03000 family)